MPRYRVFSFVLGSVLLVGLSAIPFTEHLFRSYETEIKVEQLAAARSCQSRRVRSAIARSEPFRSDETATKFGYCGSIITDGGIYLLPDGAHRITVLADQEREDLHDTLTAGCGYRVRIRGGGPRVAPGDLPVVPPRQTISRVLEALGC